MTLKDNSKLRASLTAILDDGHPELPLPQAVLENYERYQSVPKVSRVLSRYYGRTISNKTVADTLGTLGINANRAPSIYDTQLSD